MKEEEIKVQIKNYFQKAYGRRLSNTEIEEIILNLSGLFNLINQFAKQDLEGKNKLENKNGI